ncbi:MAG TPA: secondary thiamine-phosphate synthase enzyme YjbQ [archaeon]|nr:secondary thiamine-phosphate synthase enzyme YjbQ [archaeon]
MQKILLKSSKRSELIEITAQVQKIVSSSKIKNGICTVFCPHTTAGIVINENADPDVRADILKALEGLVPQNADYSHAEGNSDAHIKSVLVGNSKTLIVSDGKLELGSWCGIFFVEFDGPRQRTILVQLVE